MAVPYTPRMRTFSVTHKPGLPINPGEELALCDFTPATGTGQHAVLISWWTGSIPWPRFADTVIKYYVDGEATPSIAASIWMLTGSNATNPETPASIVLPHTHVRPPWGTSGVGRLGLGGGAYTSMKIPFASRLRVTATMAPGQTKAQTLYSLVRGLENYGPVVLPHSMVALPAGVRLRSFVSDVVLAPTEWAVLANVTSTNYNGDSDRGPVGGGALLMVVQRVKSGNAHCLEGTHVATIDGGADGDVMLSSGFEDYYLSGQYFDAGAYASPLAGMTAANHWLEPSELVAYRLHEADPVVFERSLVLKWQNGMYKNGSYAAKQTRMEALVLAYV